ncbi:ubiquinone biosynthesis hydroxylase UbiH [Jeongeupia sp. HS-3]|uniref:UbiH/UbiF family hydroxylase n=1 Tax=Jeongeupia sp. HS-3 TaxID=1009682 RepID=UPI0018A50292|nr:UbiH/UbiF family hydroxylase [Jeongeupia sp. HS-3]BCL75936.1 ubiquinone biosynthesis hydroxylase UbiH [Jeongeupia sp. HS-3]
MHYDADILIIGGGLVGTALAAALAKSTHSILLLEGRTPQTQAPSERWDNRVYAISRASQRLLSDIGAWQRLDAARIQPVSRMQITGDDGRSTLAFDALDAGLDALTTILESGNLQAALWQTAMAAPNVSVMAPAEPAAFAYDDDGVTVTLADGRSIRARLAVGADGANSWLRNGAGIDSSSKPYGQWGVVANFETELPHYGVARQWFFDDGILAWLPLAGKRISIVWSCDEARKDELLALPTAELDAKVAAAGGRALGELRCITPAAAFPLRLTHVRELVRAGVALVGDAAHTVHPLAGQGVNLGFGDVAELARVLAAADSTKLGDYLTLRRYERARREAIYVMQGACDGLQKLFNNRNPLLKTLRNTGLGLTDSLPWIKQQLIRHAMDA